MHPAFSVIFFTTASGAGYGMLTILATMIVMGNIPADRTLGILGLGIAFALVTGGLLSSTFHLGHPERAWRAFSQWRSSWLSREGVLSVLTYGPWLALAFGWIYLGDVSGIWAVAGVAAAVLAVATVFATAMIYRSLATVHQWHNGWTIGCYIFVGLASGAVVVAALLALTVGATPGYLAFTACTVFAAFHTKRLYWSYIDTTNHKSTPKTATGLKGETVRFFEGPHTEENYLMQEMGFKVARKHAEKLRKIVYLVGFLAPAMLVLIAYLVGGGLAAAACVLAAVLVLFGAIVERWLFFAEARHVVTLYYGAQSA